MGGWVGGGGGGARLKGAMSRGVAQERATRKARRTARLAPRPPVSPASGVRASAVNSCSTSACGSSKRAAWEAL